MVSSHLLSEMSQLADNVVVIGKGKLIADTSMKKLIAGAGSSVFVRVNNTAKLETALDKAGLAYKKEGKGLAVSGAGTDEVGKLAHVSGLTVLELSSHAASLEQAFLDLTEDAEEFKAKPGDRT
jgi:ABC-2 type transport system ATP-binding protein